MSESDQFRQYAEEALLWVAQSKTEREKQLLLELARTWTEAAVASAALDNCNTGSLPTAAAISGAPEARPHDEAS
jgi:hypothetical protein